MRKEYIKRFNNMSHRMVSGWWIYTHSSICFAASYFAVLQFGRVPPRIKIHPLNPSIDKSVRIFRQLEQVFQLKPHDIERVEGKWQLPWQCPCTENKHNTNNIKMFLLEKAFNYSRICAFRGASWNLTSPRKARVDFIPALESLKKKFKWMSFQRRRTAP